MTQQAATAAPAPLAPSPAVGTPQGGERARPGTGRPQMRDNGPEHCPQCRPGHPITADCPVDCLRGVLSGRVVNRLTRADGRHGQAVAPCGAPSRVGDVVRLYQQGRLGEIGGLGARRGLTEIEAGLAFARIPLGSQDGVPGRAGGRCQEHPPAAKAGTVMPGLTGTGMVADDLYLLAHDEVTGRPHLHPRAAGLGLAGALLAELMLAGCICLPQDKVMLAAGRVNQTLEPEPGQ